MNSTDHTFILDATTWSFSSINTYKTCPSAFKKTYLESLPKLSNAFAEWGTHGHKLLERYYKKEITDFELGYLYAIEYENAIKSEFPPNKWCSLKETYYEAGKEYFDNFTDIFSAYEIIGVEQKINFKVGKYNFVGYIDLLLKNKCTGKYTIIDHKSVSNKRTLKEKNEMLRQLYLYSKYVYDKFGEYPEKLIFNLFRAGKTTEEEFDIDKYNETLNWCTNTIESIYNDTEFTESPSEFFCNHICSSRKWCNVSNYNDESDFQQQESENEDIYF